MSLFLKKNLMVFMGAFCASSSIFAQQIKISKGQVLLDGTPVARIEGKINEPQLLSTLDGKAVFKMEVTNRTASGIEAPTSWTAFYLPDGTRVWEAEIDGSTGFTLSQKKTYVGKLLAMEPAFLTKEGLQMPVIEKALATKALPFSNHWDSIHAAVVQQTKIGREWSKAHKLEVENSGAVMVDGKQVGHISTGLTKQGINTLKAYSVYDMANNKIASLEAVVGLDGSCAALQEMKTYDGKGFGLASCKVDNQFLSLDGPARQIIEKLMTNGYPLAEMPAIIAKQKAEQAAAAEHMAAEAEKNALADAKKNSINLYEEPVKVMFTDGGSATGKITLLYEDLDKKMGKPKSGIIDLDKKYGTSAEFLGTDGNKERLKAKDGVMLIVGNRKFIGTKSIGDTGLGYIEAGDAIAMVTKPAYFFEVVFEDEKGNFIVHHPLAPNDLLLKLNGKEEAIYLGEKGVLFKRSLKKVQGTLAKYLDTKAMKAEQYNDFSLEGLKQIISDYNQATNK